MIYQALEPEAVSTPARAERHGAEPQESGTKWGRLRGERRGVRRLVKAGVPAVEVVGELVVEDAGTDLQ